VTGDASCSICNPGTDSRGRPVPSCERFKQSVARTGRNTTGPPWSVVAPDSPRARPAGSVTDDDDDRRQRAKRYWSIRRASNTQNLRQMLAIVSAISFIGFAAIPLMRYHFPKPGTATGRNAVSENYSIAEQTRPPTERLEHLPLKTRSAKLLLTSKHQRKYRFIDVPELQPLLRHRSSTSDVTGSSNCHD